VRSYQERQEAQSMAVWFLLWSSMAGALALGALALGNSEPNHQFQTTPWLCYAAALVMAVLAVGFVVGMAVNLRRARY